MKKYLKALFLLCICAHSGNAQQIILDNPTRAAELIVFPELGETHNYYYMPDKPRIARHPDNKPMFSFIRFVKNEKTNSEVNTSITESQTGGGVVHALVELSVSPEQVKDAERALQRLDQAAKLVGPVMFKSGTVALTSAIANKEGGYAQTVIGLGSAPVLENQKSAVAILLNPLGAKILWETFNTPTPDFSFQFEMEVAGYLKPKSVKIEADFEQMYKNQTFEAAVAMPVLQAEIGFAIDELINNGAIKVTQVGEDASLDRVRDVVINQLTNLMFERVGGSGIPQMNEMLGTNNRPSLLDRTTAMLQRSRESSQNSQPVQNSINPNPVSATNGTQTPTPPPSANPNSPASRSTGSTSTPAVTPSSSTEASVGTAPGVGITAATASGTTPATGPASTGSTVSAPTVSGSTTTSASPGGTSTPTSTSPASPASAVGSSPVPAPAPAVPAPASGTAPNPTSTGNGASTGAAPAAVGNQPPVSANNNNPGSNSAPSRSSGSSIAIAVSYKMRQTKQKGTYRVDLNKYTETTRSMPFAYNPGNIKKECKDCFREVNLDDPLMKQRDINPMLGGINAQDFAQFVNFVSVVLRKKHQNGEETVDEIKIDKSQFNQTGNFYKMQYGFKGDNDRLSWLNYEYKTKWSFFGDYTVETPWVKSDFGSIALEPPFVRKSIFLEADQDFITQEGIKAIEVSIYSTLGTKIDTKVVQLKTNKGELTKTVEILLPRNNEEYEYEIAWFLKGKEPIRNPRKKSQFGRIDLDHYQN